ncbi:MAG: hypothetical protein ABWK05_08740 [Pyrobaculum sp.]
MKWSNGLLWGLIAGLAVGIITAAMSYMEVRAMWHELLNYTYQVAYSEMVKAGIPPTQAEKLASVSVEHVKGWLIPSAIAGSVVGSVIIYVIVGVIMAAVWEKLKMPWYAKGALFSIALLAVFYLPSLLVKPPPDLPQPPKPPVMYSVGRMVVEFVGPLILAWLLNRSK